MLIRAQEKERTRIARELHDDINQKLAMLAVELEQLGDDPSTLRNRVQELRKQAAEISNDVQALSHELHSSKLEYLGVVAGMKSWCKEFAERQKMEVDFSTDVLIPPLKSAFAYSECNRSLHNAGRPVESNRSMCNWRESQMNGFTISEQAARPRKAKQAEV
jgi:signal transduction histidine kinase